MRRLQIPNYMGQRAATVREVIISGAKGGSELEAVLDDASVVISIALQHEIPAEALTWSVTRLPASSLDPSELDDGGPRPAASPIGAVLDFICEEGQA